MESKIKEIQKKFIIGMKKEMSFVDNQTTVLWKSFGPKLNQIPNRLNSDLISMALYPPTFFLNFNPNNYFTKWAGVEVGEVSKKGTLPEGLEEIEIPSGLYVVFLYKGLASQAGPFFQSIFQEWLPQSGYQLDNRPHFEVMGSAYKNEDPSSEELIYIPILKN